MSERTPHREWHFYLSDMRGFSEKVLKYTQGLDRATFTAQELVFDATLRNLELIGEAATHIPAEVRAHYSDIPWRMIIATRNRLIHAYLGIDPDTIWSIVTDDIPAFLTHLETIENRLSGR